MSAPVASRFPLRHTPDYAVRPSAACDMLRLSGCGHRHQAGHPPRTICFLLATIRLDQGTNGKYRLIIGSRDDVHLLDSAPLYFASESLRRLKKQVKCLRASGTQRPSRPSSRLQLLAAAIWSRRTKSGKRLSQMPSKAFETASFDQSFLLP